jgi:hypothetical protein
MSFSGPIIRQETKNCSGIYNNRASDKVEWVVIESGSHIKYFYHYFRLKRVQFCLACVSLFFSTDKKSLAIQSSLKEVSLKSNKKEE